VHLPAGVDPDVLVPVGQRRRLVDAAGGELAVPGNLGRLTVPSGAIEASTEVTVELLQDDSGGEPVIDLRPDGLRLARPARLELPLPAGVAADEAEIVVFDDTRGGWVPEEIQEVPAERDRIVASIAHFSLRRLRIRPGLAFPFDPRRARGAPLLVSDASNAFEALADGRWQRVQRKTTAYRDLLKAGRIGRHDLIASGRLRAVAGGDVLADELRLVALPSGAEEARTGWVRVVRLDASGAPTSFATVARVVALEPAPAEASGIVRLSRATLEALGLAWNVDFGTAGATGDGDGDGPGERSWIRVGTTAGTAPLAYLPLRIESWEPGR
jgi:hypothetical protein